METWEHMWALTACAQTSYSGIFESVINFAPFMFDGLLGKKIIEEN